MFNISDDQVLRPLTLEEAITFSENLEHAFLAEAMQNNEQQALSVIPTDDSITLFEEVHIEEIETVDFSINITHYSPEILDLSENNFIYQPSDDLMSQFDFAGYEFLQI